MHSDPLLIARAEVFFDTGKRDNGTEALAQVSDQHQLFSFLDNISEVDAIYTLEALIERQPPSATILNTNCQPFGCSGQCPQALELLQRA